LILAHSGVPRRDIRLRGEIDMFQTTVAIVAAAASAGVIVKLVPGNTADEAGTSPAAQQGVASRASEPTETAGGSMAQVAHGGIGSRDGEIICEQSWPYYEQSCLRNSSQRDGNVRIVRIIAGDHSAASRARQPRR
jgi:hypothetical protein